MINVGERSYIVNGVGSIWNPFSIEASIGKYTSIAEKLEFIASYHPIEQVSTFPFFEVYGLKYQPCSGRGAINIENDVWIGMASAIRQGCTIGDGAIIGAKAVVIQDVPPYAIVAGNPAKLIRYRFEKETVKKLLSIKWWDWDFDLIETRIKDFMDIKVFVDKYWVKP